MAEMRNDQHEEAIDKADDNERYAKYQNQKQIVDSAQLFGYLTRRKESLSRRLYLLSKSRIDKSRQVGKCCHGLQLLFPHYKVFLTKIQ